MNIKHVAALMSLILVMAACGGGDDPTADDPSQQRTEASGVETTTAATAETTTSMAATETTQDAATGTGDGTAAGAGDGDATAPGSNTLGAALLSGSEAEVTSARFEASFTFVPEPGSELEFPDAAIVMEGEFDSATGNARFLMDFGAFLSAAPTEDLEGMPPEMLDVFAEPLELITVGDTAYMKWGFFNALLGADGWVELPTDEAGTVTGQFGMGAEATSPTQMLEQLRDANATIEELGTETIRGVSTTHYRATLNLKELAETLPPDEQAELESQFGDTGIEELPMEIWVGDDGLVYRYTMEVDASSADTGMPGLQSMRMEFDMYDYGAEIIVEPPDPSEVTTIDQFGGLAGS